MDPEHIRELFGAFGPVTPRRMFSGVGVFADGVMFALVFDGVVYLKADDSAIAQFEREGSSPFEYASRNGKRVLTSYWRMPERLYDDPDELAQWAQRSADVARRANLAPRSKRRPTAKVASKRPSTRRA